jgi:anti-anti-sigma regulatory factor
MEETSHMIVKMYPVIVRTIPEDVMPSEWAGLLDEVRKSGEIQRPRIVLDCSRVRRMDDPSIHLVLSCLEEALKLNGNVKLACLRPGAQAMLKAAGVDQLFEMYSTVADAERSYQPQRLGLNRCSNNLNNVEQELEGTITPTPQFEEQLAANAGNRYQSGL